MVVTTLRSLGTTTVAGLAAALSWSERRTVRALQRSGVNRGVGVEYDRSRGTVRWISPRSVSGATTGPGPAASPSLRSSPPPAPPLARPTGETNASRASLEKSVSQALPANWKATVKCPSCQVPLEATGTSSLFYCPKCGRLTDRSRIPTGGSEVRPSAPKPPAPEGVRPVATSINLDDRRSQEMFAAWVSSGPIPCPKCRTSLRHTGLGKYRCPTCGTQVAMPRELGTKATEPPAIPAE